MADNRDLRLGELQLQVLKTLWQLGSGTVAEIHAGLDRHDELAVNTIATLLRRMEAGEVRLLSRDLPAPSPLAIRRVEIQPGSVLMTVSVFWRSEASSSCCLPGWTDRTLTRVTACWAVVVMARIPSGMEPARACPVLPRRIGRGKRIGRQQKNPGLSWADHFFHENIRISDI